MKGLYVHIPFCIKKCLYCDFNSISDIKREDDYISALVKEINSLSQRHYETIFVGGGTPTILSYNNLKRLLQALEGFKAQEYTFESNPGTIEPKKLMLMKEYGVNRLSIGLQAWQDRILKSLGRIHNIADFKNSFNSAREAGFDNINVDLMFAVPGQTLEDWEETLNSVAKLSPEHISCYSLIVEEGTAFYAMRSKGLLDVCDEDTERSMYQMSIDILKSYGYNQYEISNFSKPQRECRHNIIYWKDEEYSACGAGAHSYVDGKRCSNYEGVDAYIKAMDTGSAVKESYAVTKDESMEEFMFLGLRMNEGISKKDFQKRYGVDIREIYGSVIEKFTRMKLLYEDENRVKLTNSGVSVSNQIFVEFMR